MEDRPRLTLAGKGTEDHQFQRSLRALALDASDHLHAVGDREVKVFDPDGKLRRRFATAGEGWSVAVDADGSVWVGEEGRLEVFEAEGKRIDVWEDAAQLGRVTAIALAPEHVLVADAADRCIRRFDRDGQHLNNIGKDTRRRGFLIPNGTLDFAVDADGILHVAHPGKHRVERYRPTGELLGHFGRFDGRDPQGFSGCCNPTNVTLDRDGVVVVTEKAGPRAKRYDAEGNLLGVVAQEVFDLSCKNMDVVVDGKGRIYVADTVRLEVLVFDAPGKEDGR